MCCEYINLQRSSKEDFFSKLNNTGIVDKNYMHAKKFGINLA